MDKWAIVDVETTGMRPPSDRVIEIAIAQVDNGVLTHSWSTLINPGRSISPVISHITGIQQTDLVSAPSFEDIYDQVLELLEDRLFVAHNVHFDYKFLKAEIEQVHQSFSMPRLCSVRLSRSLYPQYRSHSLESIIKRFDIPVANRHRALDDVLAVWEFIDRSKGLLGEAKLASQIKLLVKAQSIPPNLKQIDIKRVPKTPGVYFFYDQDGRLLYIGKSINLRERVLSHFHASIQETKEQQIINKVARVEFQTCAGELDALLLESKLVKTMSPLYNSQLRRPKLLTLLQLVQEKSGLLQPHILQKSHINLDDLSGIYGSFKNKRQVITLLRNLAKDHQLCPKALDLEKGKGACFAYHLQNCRGWCTGKESTQEHNQRLQEALANYKYVLWPFNGAVSISEYSSENDKAVCHVFENWCHVCSYDTTADLFSEDRSASTSLDFDIDTYRILKRFLKKAQPLGKSYMDAKWL